MFGESRLRADSISTCRPVHPVHPDGYRTLDPSYRAHSRNQLDPYAAQPQVGSAASACVNALIPDWLSDSEQPVTRPFPPCRSAVWEVRWSCPPSPGSSLNRTGWRMISAAWALMNLIMDWDTQCTLVLFPGTTTPFPTGLHAGLGRIYAFKRINKQISVVSLGNNTLLN